MTDILTTWLPLEHLRLMVCDNNIIVGPESFAVSIVKTLASIHYIASSSPNHISSGGPRSMDRFFQSSQEES
jgi:hypothetical protein